MGWAVLGSENFLGLLEGRILSYFGGALGGAFE